MYELIFLTIMFTTVGSISILYMESKTKDIINYIKDMEKQAKDEIKNIDSM